MPSASNLADPVDHDILLIHELPCLQCKKGVTLGPSGEEAPAKQQLTQSATMCEIKIRTVDIHVRCVYKKLCKTRRLAYI